MLKNIKMPKLGVTMDEGKIIEWMFHEGSYVKKGDKLVVIESDKLSADYESPEEGYLIKVLAEDGQMVSVGKDICVLGDEKDMNVSLEEDSNASKIELQNNKLSNEKTAVHIEKDDKITFNTIKAVPLVRKLAKDKGIDLKNIIGTGPGGRILKQDVLDYQIKVNDSIDKSDLKNDETWHVEKVIELTGMRGTIAREMTKSIVEAPQGTQFIEIDATELLSLYELLKNTYDEKLGQKLSITALLIKAVSKALQENPLLNSIVKENKVHVIENINIGVAVGVEEGIYVPVIHNVHKLKLFEIVEKLNNNTLKAKNNKLTYKDMENRTFTITNLGMYGSYFFTPLLNPPESASLGVGSIVKRSVVVNDKLEIRPILPLSLTMDHRSVDGIPGARFLQTVKNLLETTYKELIIDIEY